jgi:ATP-dependent Clp protease protease subunit
LNTLIIEQTDNGDVSFDVFSKLIESRILFLSNYIDDTVATDIAATLLYLDNDNDKNKISLYINSEGGNIQSVFMIYDIMQLIHSPIETFCIGSAQKEASLILAAGTKGMRYATQSSIVSINQLLHGGSSYSDITNAEIILEKSKKDNHNFIEALSKCTGKSIKLLEKETEREFFLFAEDAKKFGIIDNVIKN